MKIGDTFQLTNDYAGNHLKEKLFSKVNEIVSKDNSQRVSVNAVGGFPIHPPLQKTNS